MKYDFFVLTKDGGRKKAWEEAVPTAKFIEHTALTEETFKLIGKQTLTKFFFVVRGDLSTESGIDLDFEPDENSLKHVHVWGENNAMRLFNRRQVKRKPENFTDEGVRNAKCKLKFLELENEELVVASGWEWFDTVEEGMDKSTRPFFFVKDPTVNVMGMFDNSFTPSMWEEGKVHAFQRINPVNGEVIDHGGVNLYPINPDDDGGVVLVDTHGSVETQFGVRVVEDINLPIEFEDGDRKARFMWVIDPYLDLGEFNFDHYPSVFDSDVLHIWRTDFGVPSVKLVPVGVTEPRIKEMDEPVGSIPRYMVYDSLEEGYELCSDAFFWVSKDGATFNDDFRQEFYAKEVQDDNYWWRTLDWVEDKINCFQTVDLDGKHHSAEGFMLCPVDPTKNEKFYIEELAGTAPIKEEVPDIVFLSYDEEYADANYERLLKRYPDAKRVHGVKGIFEAHKKAAEIATTKRFFLVDADAQIDDDFDMHESLGKLRKYPDDTVYVWRSRNPVNGLEYGYGGLKCFPREEMLNARHWNIDFSTSLSGNFVPVQEVSNTTAYNTSVFNTWRGAFRECVKLSSRIIRKQKTEETEHRLKTWCTVNNDTVNGKHALMGALEGKAFGARYSGHPRMLGKINDFDWLNEYYKSCLWRDMGKDLQEFPIDSLTLNNIIRVSELHPHAIKDMCSKGQLASKAWLHREFPSERAKDFKQAHICAGWFGFGASVLRELINDECLITSIDIDPVCESVAKMMNSVDTDRRTFDAMTADIREVDYTGSDLVINTSCEHIEHIDVWYDKIPKGTMVVLQSNDYHKIDDHVNCVDSADELLASCPMSECIFKGGLELPDYTRFMVIGIK